jgi:hypothetical protein
MLFYLSASPAPTDPTILGCAEFRLRPCSVCQTELDKGKDEPTMPARRTDTREEIVAKLRQVDVPVSQGIADPPDRRERDHASSVAAGVWRTEDRAVKRLKELERKHERLR